MHIRTATIEDLHTISTLLKVLDTPEFHVSDTTTLIKEIEQGWHFVATDKEGIIRGSLALRLNEGSYEIVTIVSQHEGFGKALIEFCIEKCKAEKISKLWCWSLASYNAKGFYEKMGFEEQHLLKKQWFGQDCYFFGKQIDIKTIDVEQTNS